MRGPVLVTMLLFLASVAEEAARNCSDHTECHTRSCVSAAAELLGSLDASIDPCDDFYHYACGGWMNRLFLTPETESVKIAFGVRHLIDIRKMLVEPHKPTDLDAEKKAKSLYASCVNHAPGITEDAAILKAVSDRFDHWPLACPVHDPIGYDLETFLTEAIQIGVHPLFHLQAHPEILAYNYTTKSAKRYLYVGAPVLGLPINDYAYFRIEPEYRQIFADAILAAARRFGVEDNNTTRQVALDIVRVEETLAMMHNNRKNQKHIWGPSESLDDNYGQLMNWTRFLNTLASAPHVGLHPVAAHERLVVHYPHYLNETINYFLQLPKRTQANYIIWRVVDTLQSVLIDVFQKLTITLEHAVLDSNMEQIREEACTKFVSDAFHLVLYRKAYALHATPKKLQEVENMVTQLKKEFVTLLGEHRWVDNKSAENIKHKIESTSTLIMYLTKASDKQYVEAYYSNVRIAESNFINNVVAARRDAFVKNFQSTRNFTKMEIWTPPEDLFAQFLPELHEIQLTAVTFQPPYYLDNAPVFLNYAGTGEVIGHELSHVVDPIAYRYQPNGTVRSLWSNVTEKALTDRVSCLIDQYSGYLYKTAGKFLHGKESSRENIADNLAIQLAYKAYKTYTRSKGVKELGLPGLTFINDKVFFLRAAQLWCEKQTNAVGQFAVNRHHSPNEFRINGPFQNFEEFSRTFNCPLGSGMNPVHKCKVW